MLNNDKKLLIFQAQTRNVRELQATWAHLKRLLHRDLTLNNLSSAAALTRLLALTYCAWTEALFSKLIHTPYGFTCSEIESIKLAGSKNVVAGWKACVKLGLTHVISPDPENLEKAKTTLNEFVKTYIQAPSELRNKIAHGQLVEALNSKSDGLNKKLTQEILGLDIVKLDRLRTGAAGLAEMIEMIIESPEKNGIEHFLKVNKRLSAELKRMSSFTIEGKIALLKSKDARVIRSQEIVNKKISIQSVSLESSN